MNDNKYECHYCEATGLYCGFAEKKGTAVICSECGGKGHLPARKAMKSSPVFTERRARSGVKRVYADGGLWMVRSENKTISIEEFEDKIKP